jgi:hypothetical protein
VTRRCVGAIRRSRRRVLLLLLVAAAALAVATTSPVAAATKGRCDRLEGRDLYPKNPQVKLVLTSRTSVNEVGLAGTQDTYRACAGHHGRVHVVDSTGDDDFESSGLHPGASAGRFFLMQREDDSPDEVYFNVRVFDARTGRARELHDDAADENAGIARFDPGRFVLDRSGAAAAVFTDPNVLPGGPASTNLDPGLPAGTTRYVAAFDRRGRRTVLDAGRTEIRRFSLGLRAGVLSWRHGAEIRTHALRARESARP